MKSQSVRTRIQGMDSGRAAANDAKTSQDSRSRRRKRLAIGLLTAASMIPGVLAAGSLTAAEPGPMGAMMDRVGRFWGFGWGDGYNACRDGGCQPGADLPPTSYTDMRARQSRQYIGGPVVLAAHANQPHSHAPCASGTCYPTSQQTFATHSQSVQVPRQYAPTQFVPTPAPQPQFSSPAIAPTQQELMPQYKPAEPVPTYPPATVPTDSSRRESEQNESLLPESPGEREPEIIRPGQPQPDPLDALAPPRGNQPPMQDPLMETEDSSTESPSDSLLEPSRDTLLEPSDNGGGRGSIEELPAPAPSARQNITPRPPGMKRSGIIQGPLQIESVPAPEGQLLPPKSTAPELDSTYHRSPYSPRQYTPARRPEAETQAETQQERIANVPPWLVIRQPR
ncbi:hypothetical protein [Stieleria varia]|nr:hypothetical protein [Stieleria varia]